SANGVGISLEQNAERNLVQGNLIGTQRDDTTPPGNAADGALIWEGATAATASNNTIGRAPTQPGNTIAYNAGHRAAAGSRHLMPDTTFRLEFFAKGECDPSQFGGGESFLSFAEVTTDGSGDATFSETIAPAITGGQSITATAIDPSGNASEFSQCRIVETESES